MERIRFAPLVALALLVATAPPAPAAPHVPAVVVTIEPQSPTTLHLGRTFNFDVVVTNNLPAVVEGALSIVLDSPRPGESIDLEAWAGRIPALDSTRFSRSVSSGRYFETIGRFEVQVGGEFILLAAREAGVVAAPYRTLPVHITAPPVVIPRFQDVTQQVGITTRLRTHGLCQDYAAGAAWGDVDGDGRLDLYIPQRTGASELWINLPSGFVERAADYGVTNQRVGEGSNFIDYDDDGDLDLFVLNDGVNRLYRRTGPGFTDVTASAGLVADGNHTSAAWGDYDRDGILDVFVTSHGRRSNCAESFQQYPDRLYRGNGDGTFTNVSHLLPVLSDGTGLTFQGSWFDYNNDGLLDLHASNDRVNTDDEGNILWRNDGLAGGQWRFTDVSSESGAGVLINSMGTGIGDYNRDGFLDLVISDLGPLTLLKNNGNGTFTESAAEAGVDRGFRGIRGAQQATWGLTFEDLNGDAWEDLFVAAGMLDTSGNPTNDQPDQIFVNDGTGRFLDLSGPTGAADPAAGRGLAFADYDQDGRTDVFVMNVDGAPKLYRNVTPGFGRWLEIRVFERPGGRSSCGARLQVVGVNPPIVREVYCGSTSLSSGTDPSIRLGLGALGSVTLRVDWPTGDTLTVPNVPTNQVLTVIRP